jgi:hypothetical protein
MRIQAPKHWLSTVHKFENAFQMLVIIQQKMNEKDILKNADKSQGKNKLVQSSEPETDVQRTVPGSA